MLRSYLLVISLLCFVTLATAAETPLPPSAAIATAHPLATAAGEEVLRQGGNAFDAAVAVSASLAVVEPMGSGLGGGGFWLLHRAQDGYEIMVDGREKAPLAATADMYLDEAGEPRPRASLDGPLAAAIPGVPAALVHIAERYGRLPLKQSLAPAIRYARQGFPVSERYRALAERRLQVLRSSPAAARRFLQARQLPEIGFIIRQPELAETLERLASKGRDGFYDGIVANRLLGAVRAAGGIWSREDLLHYQVKERRPIQGRYGALRITSAAPPSSGGIVLMQTLNILQGFNIQRIPAWQRQHLIIEAMRLSYRDRARYLGDSDYVQFDSERLLSPAYAARKREQISLWRARPSVQLGPKAVPIKGRDTTHFSILDQAGNRVAATLSINYPFGCGFVPPGTGVLLNNEMDDFVMKPGAPNVYGLVGNKANAIASGKRPLSSMTPTFVEGPNGVLIVGTPGGSRIISMVLLASLEYAEGRGGVQDWVGLPRYHHQYLPDRVEYEPDAFSAATLKRLQRMGHELKLRESGYGNMQAVYWDRKRGQVTAASDPRGEGLARVESLP